MARGISDSKRDPSNVNTDSPLDETSCPVSEVVLRELYWRKRLSIVQIALWMNANYSISPTERTVARWLKLAGIPTRKRGDNFRTQAHRKMMSDLAKERHRSGDLITIPRPDIFAKLKYAQRKKNAFALIRFQKERARRSEVNVKCGLPGCDVIVKRQAWQLRRHKAGFSYCCHSHANSHQNQLLKQESVAKVCSVRDCVENARFRGMCPRHYRQHVYHLKKEGEFAPIPAAGNRSANRIFPKCR